MIDALHRIATRIGVLRYIAVILGGCCLAALLAIVFVMPASGVQNQYLVPALVGFIWCLCAYGFIDTFQAVPGKADPGRDGFVARIRNTIYRGWFWLLAGLFILSTLAVLIVTLKLGSFWLGRYFG